MTVWLAMAGLWALGFVFLWRIPVCRRSPGPTPGCSLSVIIPARDEEETLPALLASLREQDPSPDEIIVVDDASRDRTAAVAAAGGARVLASRPLPSGWRGKTWACHQGAGEAAGEVLIFMDADTRLEPGALRALRDTYARQPGVLSLGPYHRVCRFHEQFSAFFNLLMTAGTAAFTILGGRLRPRGLFGPFLMVDRRAYEAIGGHEAVRGRILEHFFMAPLFAQAGIPLRCYGGRGTVTMRMYPQGWGELKAGWSKAFATGAAQTPPGLLLLIMAWLAGSLLAAGGLAGAVMRGAPCGPWLAVYGVYAAQLYAMLIRIGSFRWFVALLYPVPLLFYMVVFMHSVIRAGLRKDVSWKGRHIDLTEEG
jgi:4,4'-diaponeurosporenoate glycosyltransferase